MVNSREELIQVASEWMAQASTDIRENITAFMQTNGISEDEIINILAISPEEFNSIMNGGDIALSTFAKLLIATDNVIEIKPTTETPLGYGGMPMEGRMPMNGGMPMGGRAPMPMNGGMPMGGRMPRVPMEGRMPMGGRAPMPMGGRAPMPMGGRAPMPMGGRAPMPMGGRMPRVPMEGRMPMNGGMPMGGTSDMSQMSRNELCDIIISNGWQNCIDLEEATKSQLVNFIASKRSIHPTQQVNANGGFVTDPVVEQFKGALAKAMSEGTNVVAENLAEE